MRTLLSEETARVARRNELGSRRDRVGGTGVGVALLLGAAVLVAVVGNAQGGYHPPAWGWTVLGLAWVALVALAVSPRVTFGRLELGFLACLSLLVGWTALSVFWSADVEGSVLEVQRALVYLTCAFAGVLVVRRANIAYLLGGLVAGATWLAVDALADRLSPELTPGIEVIFQDRLASALGYANAFGLLGVMGILLALGIAVHARHLAVRVAAGAVLPVLMTATYFTYSRGALIALVAGLLAAIALDRKRLTLLTVGMLVALPAAVAVWIAAGSEALSSASASPAAITDEGRDLWFALLGLTLLTIVVTAAVGWLEARIRVPRTARRAYAIVLACVAAALVTGAVIHYGGPGPLIEKAAEDIDRDVPSTIVENDLNRRLSGIGSTGRINYWRVAWDQYEAHPLVGSGAGTYERFWLRDRSTNEHARDAHSLYLETLAQLGWPGLLLLLGALALPLLAALRAARHEPLVVGALAAYVAYVVRTGIDWDWEMPVLTLLALLCAAALFAARDDDRAPWELSPRGRAAGAAATVAVVVFCIVGLVGNRALAEAKQALDRSDPRAAQDAATTAVKWAPWSAEAHARLGRARLEAGRAEQGRADLREATRANPNDWRLWYDLAVASRGRERQRAFVRAARLNPMGRDIEALRDRGLRIPKLKAPL